MAILSANAQGLRLDDRTLKLSSAINPAAGSIAWLSEGGPAGLLDIRAYKKEGRELVVE
jgi:hypothetical protein